MRALQLIATSLCAIVVSASPARPCKVASQGAGGLVDGATLGPLPLLFGLSAPSLRRVDDPTARIELAPDPSLGDVMVGGKSGQAWRPLAPLLAGEYLVFNALVLGSGQDVRIFVDPALDDLRGCAAGPHGLEHAQNLGLWLVALVLVRVRLARRVRRADDIPIS